MSILNQSTTAQCAPPPFDIANDYNKRMERNEQTDMHLAVDFLFDFYLKLKLLHPGVENTIHSIIRNRF